MDKAQTENTSSTETEEFQIPTEENLLAATVRDTRETVASLAKEIAKEFKLHKETKMATDYDKYPHYFKRIPEGMTHIDVYGVLRLFDVKSQEIGHAIKKLLVPGVRGTKSKSQDIQEAIDTLERWKQLNKEFELKAAEPAEPSDEDFPKLAEKEFSVADYNLATCLAKPIDSDIGTKLCTCETDSQVKRCQKICSKYIIPIQELGDD